MKIAPVRSIEEDREGYCFSIRGKSFLLMGRVVSLTRYARENLQLPKCHKNVPLMYLK